MGYARVPIEKLQRAYEFRLKYPKLQYKELAKVFEISASAISRYCRMKSGHVPTKARLGKLDPQQVVAHYFKHGKVKEATAKHFGISSWHLCKFLIQAGFAMEAFPTARQRWGPKTGPQAAATDETPEHQHGPINADPNRPRLECPLHLIAWSMMALARPNQGHFVTGYCTYERCALWSDAWNQCGLKVDHDTVVTAEGP